MMSHLRRVIGIVSFASSESRHWSRVICVHPSPEVVFLEVVIGVARRDNLPPTIVAPIGTLLHSARPDKRGFTRLNSADGRRLLPPTELHQVVVPMTIVYW